MSQHNTLHCVVRVQGLNFNHIIIMSKDFHFFFHIMANQKPKKSDVK